ncbi:MAG: SMP-30/gluconolactonase/LRE family protein [Verrucomicrobiae bacterium]|nr:SMP-30/gluconolactonase/LRE family protein [Verrucomicrobiae bacterium]
MRQISLAILLMVSWPVAITMAEEESENWKPLFDGKSLEGWKQRGGEAKYRVENETIVGTTVPKTPNSFLCTEKDYGDFALEFEFKVDPHMNSGVQFRSQSLPDYKNGQVHGYQCEIDPSDRGWTAGIYDEGRRGWLNDLTENRDARYAFHQLEWNHVRIEAIGDRLRTWLNGVPAADLRDDMTARGFIALQVHGVGENDEAMEVSWRNLRINESPKPSPEVAEDDPIPSGSVVPEQPEIRKLAEGFKFTEGPALGPNGKIFFNDIPNERTHVYDPETGKTRVFRAATGRANGLFWTPAQAMVACEGGNRRLTRICASGEVKVLASEFDGKRFNSPNDLVIDPFGGIYFTDPHYGNDKTGLEMEVEGVYYLDRKSRITRVADNLTKPNGLILSPDNRILYIADPGAETIWAYDVTGEGKIENQRKFAAVGSDGMTIDTAGNVYCTWKGEVWIFDPSGKEAGRIAFPEGPANCLLVGPTLYVTARMGFYAVDLNARGLRP